MSGTRKYDFRAAEGIRGEQEEEREAEGEGRRAGVAVKEVAHTSGTSACGDDCHHFCRRGLARQLESHEPRLQDVHSAVAVSAGVMAAEEHGLLKLAFLFIVVSTVSACYTIAAHV